MSNIELESCPMCGGGVTLWVNMDVGAFASCHSCRNYFSVCCMNEIPLYCGCRIRKSTKEKIKRKWNSMAIHLRERQKGGETNGQQQV